VPSGDVIIYTRHYMSPGSRGNIVQDILRAYITRASGNGGSGRLEKETERERERRDDCYSMAGFYYRDHLFVNIIYTLRGGGSAVARATLSSTRQEERRISESMAFRHGGRFFAFPPSIFCENHFDLLMSDGPREAQLPLSMILLSRTIVRTKINLKEINIEL